MESTSTSALNRNRSFKTKQLVRSQAIRESQSPPRTASPNQCGAEEADLAYGGGEEAPRVDHLAYSGAEDAPRAGNLAYCGAEDALRAGDLAYCGAEEAPRAGDLAYSVVVAEEGVADHDMSSQVLNTNDTLFSDNSLIINNNNSFNGDFEEVKKAQPVEIQITSGGWESEHLSDQRQRTRRWLGYQPQSDWSYDLLSHSPRVTCVCGECRSRPRSDDHSRSRTCPVCRGRRRKHSCPIKQDSGIVCSDECPDCSDSETNDLSPSRPKKVDSPETECAEVATSFCRCSERNDKPKNASLIRNDSEDKSEPTGVELINFIKDTLNKNAKDRITLLKIEKELHALVNDPGRCVVRFPVMTSYGRMLVHRCATLFQLSHNLDQMNKGAVLVSKSGTSGGRIPCTAFRSWCSINFPPSSPHDMQAKSILKRDAHSLDETNGGACGQGNSSRSKSLEQREKDYERTRRRIFSTENYARDDPQWSWLKTGTVKLLTQDARKNRLLKVQSLESSSPSQQPSRGAVAKSHSFGGYEPPPQPTRLLSRQGDLASSSWRLSPSSSGYKTLSLRSTDSVTPSPTGGVSPEPAPAPGPQGVNCERPLMWAVTDLAAVPPGALIIHPQTGRPLTNADGTLYQYDPTHPPVFHDAVLIDEENDDESSDKRRGRLEKQQSFMENEYDCQTEEYQKQCCCECKQLDWSEESNGADGCQVCEAGDKDINELTEENNSHHSAELCADQYELPACDMPTNEVTGAIEPANQEADPLEEDNCPYGVEYQNEEYVNNEHITLQPEPKHKYPADIPSAQVTPTPVSYHENAMRHIQPGGAVYQTSVNPAAYTYPSHCRTEQALYQLQEDPTKMAAQPLPEPAYHSYPYAAEATPTYAPHPATYAASAYTHTVNCAGACGVDPTTGAPGCAIRSFALTYGQGVEPGAVLPQGYPIANVYLPQPQMQYQYPQALQWPGLQPMLTPGLASSCATQVQKPTSPPNMYLPPPEMPLPYHPQQVNYTKQPEMINYQVNGQVYPLVQYPGLQYGYQGCQGLGQVVPHYQMCQQVYPFVEKPDHHRRGYESAQRFNAKKNSVSGSSRTTPLDSCTPPAVDVKYPVYEKTYQDRSALVKQPSFVEGNAFDNRRKPMYRSNSARSDVGVPRQGSTEIALKIQQIKEQLAQMNTSGAPALDRRCQERPRSYEDVRHMNRNPGILGSYPNSNHFNNRFFNQQRQVNDDGDLSTAARAIVTSLCHLQTKTNYNHDSVRRHEYPHQHAGYQYRNNYYKHPDVNPRREYRRPDSEAYRDRNGSRVEGQPIYRNDGQPMNRSEAQPIQRNEAQPIHRSENQPINRSEGPPNNRSESQPNNRNESQSNNRSEGYPINRSEGHPMRRSEGQPNNRSESQPNNRSEGQIATRNEAQAAPRADSQPVRVEGETGKAVERNAEGDVKSCESPQLKGAEHKAVGLLESHRAAEVNRGSQVRPEGVLGRGRPVHSVSLGGYRQPFVFRQVPPGLWRRSPGPLPPGLHHPRRPHPDTRYNRR